MFGPSEPIMVQEANYEENDAAVADRGGRSEKSRVRARPPRFGSFVTIAAAVLMLFGTISRLGKPAEIGSLFGLDRQAENRIRQEEERLRTAIVLGGLPVPATGLRPRAGEVPIEYGVLPPVREEIDPETVRRHYDSEHHATVSLAVPEDFFRSGDDSSFPVETAPASIPVPAGTRVNTSEYYVVVVGDTWAKIAVRTLGDIKRWEEIRRANPVADAGLRVGMRLVIPRT